MFMKWNVCILASCIGIATIKIVIVIYLKSIISEDNEQEVIPLKPGSITLNCTVAFMATCTSMIKCRSTCQSMSAFSFRWFHDGCCECVGEYCINYGINQSR